MAERAYCDGCGERYKLENMNECCDPGCSALFCSRCAWSDPRGHHFPGVNAPDKGAPPGTPAAR